LVVNKLESFILSKEVLQVQGVIDEEWQAKEEAIWKQRLTQFSTNQNLWVSWQCVTKLWVFFVLNDSGAKVDVQGVQLMKCVMCHSFENLDGSF
jgi:hypothetical protein